ncbi:MAG: D-sedoheptulose 7-phosphate isomerase [Dialister sp.]|nr:D-sedoheptulose 7-phosphate isomerase [Dialister sp.]
MKTDIVAEAFEAHEQTLLKIKALIPHVIEMAALCVAALRRGNKILLCGNGGSAADAQHIAAELVGRFHNERKSLPAIALTTDSSILTSVANDYSFEDVFSRQVEGLGTAGDVFWGISTSGNSLNVVKAARLAREKGLTVIASLGRGGGQMKALCDACVIIPSESTPRTQEMHILCAHSICQIIDEETW